MSWFMLAAFPLAVLTIVQLSALRYQDWGIIGAQWFALTLDAGLLVCSSIGGGVSGSAYP